ncbi:sulfurtransferase [Conexibacter sp. JD483]|uniref:sulfurtransferase n=1 Tax=unclassified Conexibacter TaxID=2627773 RepID=UPI0027279F26|nr:MULTISPECIES: sulfurtransferase [unclassified Conexibacter]MDO8186894.1 sulfurtransferase [Conexibacter sp. CPCC 205706]MDO8200794.1 sulfurtransferase [Conexibacter sp. CPCC 205762]MDR9369930.1 sulfurtransferase [Conexibacter sp. JD483]
MSQDWLAARLEEPRLRVVDCRFTLGDPLAGRAAYAAGHIPGAVFLDLDADLSDPPGAPAPGTPERGPVGGRHPLPALDRFAAAVRRAGIGAGTTVVAYDDAMSGGAARLWWLLRHCGFRDVAVLDGGLAAWEGPLGAGGEPPPSPGDFAPSAADLADDLVTADELAHDLQQPPGERRYLVLDARAPERFRGEAEPLDPVAGHIPGARNLLAAQAFPPPADLPADTTLVASCGSGVTATALVLALTAAGREDVKLYAGSWSDWVARGLPIASGEATDEAAG